MENLDNNNFNQLTNDEIDLLGKQLLEGNKQVKDILLEYYLEFTKLYIKKHYFNYHDQDSLLSYGLQGLEKALETYEPSKGPLGAYAFYKIKHYILDAFKAERRYLTNNDIYSLYEHDEQLNDPSQNVELSYEKIEQLKLLKLFIEDLPPRDKDILKNYFGIGCTPKKQRDLAVIYNVSPPRITQIVQRSLTFLKTRSENEIAS